MAWWEWAQVGDDVVCIEEIADSQLGSPSPVSVGDVRTIQGICSVCGVVYIDTGDFGSNGLPCLFDPDCFRPVERDRTASGMTTIRNILNTSPVKEEA